MDKLIFLKTRTVELFIYQNGTQQQQQQQQQQKKKYTITLNLIAINFGVFNSSNLHFLLNKFIESAIYKGYKEMVL